MFPYTTSRYRFYKENKTIWNDESISAYRKGASSVFAVHALSWHFEYSVLVDLAARGLGKKYGLPVIALSYGLKEDAFIEGDESFGITGIYEDINNYIEAVKQKIDDRSILDSYHDRNKILNMVYKNVKCGNAVWDAMSIYSIEWLNVSQSDYLNIVRKAYSIIDLAYAMFEKYSPAFLVVDEGVRLDSLFFQVASRYSMKIIPIYRHKACKYGCFKLDKNDVVNLYNRYLIKKIKQSHICFEQTESLYIDDYSSFNEREIQLITNNKSNVYIMLHAFQDASRTTVYHNVYTDYTEWFEKTMEIISKISDVNWIIRDHPMAKGGSQPKYVKDMIARYKSPNIFLSDIRESRDEIAQNAKAIITYSGDVGIEYWAQGVPTIMLSETYYAWDGISYVAHSEQEYIRLLKNIDRLEKPTDESKEKAKRILSIIKEDMKSDDELSNLFSDIFIMEQKGISEEIRDYDLYEYKFIEGYIKLAEEDKIKTSKCYLLTDMIEVD